MWNLKLEDINHLIEQGPDEDARRDDLAAVLSRFKDDSGKRCLQIGINYPYTEKHAPHFVSLDKHDKSPHIDIRRDLADTGLPSESFDFIICNAILEHVRNPFECGRELGRIAAPGCEIWCEVPFVQPFHPTKSWDYSQGYMLDQDCGDVSLPRDENHGGDYWRFSPQGIAVILESFSVKRIYIVGPGGVVMHGIKS
jgi:hypothetical protein